MSRYLVGPSRFGNSEATGLTGEMYFQRPEKTSQPCLNLFIRVENNKATPHTILLGPAIFIMSAQRCLSPSSRAGDVVRLPRFEASFAEQALRPGSSTLLEVDVPVDSATIQKLDDLRGPEYGLYFAVRVRLPFSTFGQNSVVGSSGNDLQLEFTLTNDHWRELLNIWDWPRIRVFEIRASSFPNVKTFDIAAKKLIEAQRALEQGDAQGSIGLSRDVIDAVLDRIRLDDHTSERFEKHGGRKGSLGQSDFRQAGVPDEIWHLYVALTEIATAAEQADGDVWSHHEARMMLAIAAGMAEHLGSVFQRARATRP